MEKFNSAREVPKRCLGQTVLIDGEEVYVNAEFIIGKLLSGHGAKEEYLEAFLFGIIIPLLVFGCFYLQCKCKGA